MFVLGEKLGARSVDQSADVLTIVSAALFLENSRICPNLFGQRQRLPRTGTVHEKRTSGIHGPAKEAYTAVSACLLQSSRS
jgi:hypothetical protein